MLFRRSSKGLRDIGCERPHAALVELDHVIAGIEADGLVVHIQPPAPQLSPPLLVGQPCRGIPVVVFDPHPPSCVIAQSKRVIQVPRHVLNVAVQAHARVEEHGDGGPGAVRKAALEEVVHGRAGLPQARSIGDAEHAAVPEKPQRCILLVRPWLHRPGAPTVLPVRRPQVQQPHQIGFGGLLRGVPARRFHFLHCRHLSLQTRVPLKHHAAPQFF